MSATTITTERRGHVFFIGLDRAAKRNAFTTTMLRELALAYGALEDDPEAWVGVLFAHGDHFTGGLDLAEVGPAVAAGAKLFPDEGVDPLDLFGRRRSKPVVCAVRGVCFTIGIELMLACDVAVAARGTRFAQMEVRRGIMPFGGATLRFPTAAGRARAMKWLLTGDEFTAHEALDMGLVADVVDDGRDLEAATSIAERIAARAPLAVRATRKNALLAAESGRDAALAGLMDAALPLFATDDAREGVMSFLERREAKFTGH
jgi:enoyl-CoA hydratase/carnithine racemase